MFFNWIGIIAGGMALCFAIMEGKKANHASITAVIVGLLTGVACFIVAKAIILWIPERLHLIRKKNVPQEATPRSKIVVLWFFTLAAVVWLFVSAFLGSWITRWVIHWR
jgi:predicted small integral membrane protein